MEHVRSTVHLILVIFLIGRYTIQIPQILRQASGSLSGVGMVMADFFSSVFISTLYGKLWTKEKLVGFWSWPVLFTPSLYSVHPTLRDATFYSRLFKCGSMTLFLYLFCSACRTLLSSPWP